MCAQKTLTVAAPAVGAVLGGADAAVALLPCVAVHLGQTALDAWLVARGWVGNGGRGGASEK